MGNAESGIDYNCMSTQPNPYWFNIAIETPGSFAFEMSQINSTGNFTDVDYILWGPFSSPVCGAENLNPSTQISCSFSAEGVENFAINNAQPGEFYKLLVTNFSNQPGTVTITQTNVGQPGSGTTNCSAPCPLELLGGAPYACSSLILTVAPSYPGITYQWSSSVTGILPETGSSLLITEPATYSVTVTIPNCGAPTTLTHTVIPYSLNHPKANDLSVCSDQPSAQFDLTQNAPVVVGGLDQDYY